VIFAQVQDDRPLRIGQFRYVEGGGLLAMHAFHSASPLTISKAFGRLVRLSNTPL
jgi:hypothetical protein